MPLFLHNISGFTIVHDPIQCCLHLTWQGAHSARDAQSCCLEVLAQVHLTASTKILNDATLDGAGWQDITPWLAHEFFTQLAVDGVTAVAWVIPRNLRAHSSMDQVINTVKQLTIGKFEDVESAYTWLCQWQVITY